MSRSDADGQRDELADVAELIRRCGPEPSPLQLDSIKRRALAGATRPTAGKEAAGLEGEVGDQGPG